ncbi:MAG: alpha/beta fold hydrolase [Beijerinckiaceae bacterium]
MADGADKLREVRGLTLKVDEKGKGEPLLFLHGAGGSNWSPMLEELSKDFRVIAPEHPGFGRSTIPDWMMSVGDLAFFYLDFIEALGLENVHLAGHSLGGWLTAEIAVRNTSRLASVTLMAPAGIANPDAPFGDIFLWSAEEAARSQFYNQELAEKRLKATPDLDVTLQNKSAVARLAWSPRLCNPQLHYWIHRIDRPSQLIWGKQDKVIPFACNKAWVDGVGGIALHALDECGHAIHNEKAPEAAALIAAHCKAAAAKGAK